MRIRGYTDRQSAKQGHTLNFCLADLDGKDALQLPIHIFKLGLQERLIHAGVAELRAPRASISRAWESNGWETGYTLAVGHDWMPGIYAARIGDMLDDSPDIFFVVTNASPGSATPIVAQIPTTTINAYNNWGGASLYRYNSQSEPAPIVSFNRPQYGFENEWLARLKDAVCWLEAADYRVDFITNNDLHEDKELLQHYQLFISLGHDEYWSRSMRDNFDAFVACGGNAAILGGNTCCWQIRLERDELTGAIGRRQVCYKDADTDPVADTRLKTITWQATGDPENRTFGAGWARGAWRGSGRKGAFTVYRSEHWVFAETDLRAGDAFGDADDESILVYETNGVDYRLDVSGRPIPTGVDGTPGNYLILALAELSEWGTPGNAALGVLESPGSGTIFNAATTDWARGLRACIPGDDHCRTATAKITRNVIAHLSRKRTASVR
jgi:hypothetical protein